MVDPLVARITSAVTSWAIQKYKTNEVYVGQAAPDGEIDDEAARYLVDFAVRDLGAWLVAEVWVSAAGAILNVNDLGEGLPLEDDARWPWPEEASG